MSVTRTARERARTELTGEITAEARRQLAEHGAAALSLRAVARELGMVSSALYRYFPSRDELLTALIIDAYAGLAEAVVAAQARAPRRAHRRRWLSACREFRRWALAHPQEYALVYGSPVPGYRAPPATVEPAARVFMVFLDIVADARLDPPVAPAPNGRLAAQLTALAAGVERDVTPAALAATLLALSQLLGMLTMELGGHLVGSVDPADPFAEHAITAMADLLGL